VGVPETCYQASRNGQTGRFVWHSGANESILKSFEWWGLQERSM